MVSLLSDAEVSALRRSSLTYAEAGATATDQAPLGYTSFTRSITLNDTTFEDAVERLMTWRIQEGAGLQVRASSLRVEQDAVVLMRLGVGPVGLSVPCRVTYAVVGPDAAGFAYGTLEGHPESGEEFFFQERFGDRVTFMVRAFSRPQSRLARAAGPIGRRLQQVMTSRYLAAANG